MNASKIILKYTIVRSTVMPLIQGLNSMMGTKHLNRQTASKNLKTTKLKPLPWTAVTVVVLDSLACWGTQQLNTTVLSNILGQAAATKPWFCLHKDMNKKLLGG